MADRGRILDVLDDVVIAVDRGDRVVYANRAARRWLPLSGTDRTVLSWPQLLEIVGEARLMAEPVRRAGIALGESRSLWYARLWPVDGGCIAAVLRPEPRSAERETVIAQCLGLTPDQALLALRIAEGRPNRDIAHDFSVTVSTVKGRLWRLYRKLGIRNRAELAAQIVSALSAPTPSVAPAVVDVDGNVVVDIDRDVDVDGVATCSPVPVARFL